MSKIVKILYTVILLNTFSVFAGPTKCVKNDTLPVLPSLKEINKISNTMLRSSSPADGIFLKNGNLAKTDKRVPKTLASPNVLDSVGKIEITTDRTSICSGTLISDVVAKNSRLVQTSNHCFPSGVKKIIWKTTVKGKEVSVSATIIWRNISDDLAVILLDRSLSLDEVPHAIIPIDFVEMHSPETIIDEVESGTLFFAGHSADKELGKTGKVLTYESSKISMWEEVENEKYLTIEKDFTISRSGYLSNAFTFQGASGGGVILHADTDMDNVNDTPYLIGVIKGGKGDSKVYTSSSGATGGDETVIIGFDYFAEDMIELIKKYNY